MLELAKVSLDFGAGPVLRDCSLRVAPGERVGLLGASGGGKSSLLKLACGLLRPGAGHCRNTYLRTTLVFQEPRLLPWRRVRDNLVLPLRAAGHPAGAAERIACEWLERVGLAAVADRWPGQLSGGMAQRASLARAFALAPDLLLLDEPFSALDPGLRHSLARLCDDLLRQSGASLLCVSHHPNELVPWVDRCVLLQDGRAQAFDDCCDDAARAATARALQQALQQVTH
ncbi:MAG TPA: ATP-binding cassette domain-containing protein [Rhodanobacteraceae bacterium]|nr:ATP-binding cassette domain-containing protein [Rhodanobacteraceae bacterium]